MPAYSEDYLQEVVENQGKLFISFAENYPSKDTEDFIISYMKSKTRKNIDECQVYLSTMDYKGLLSFFLDNEKYQAKNGYALSGFLPDWIGEFYAYYQWYYNVPSSILVEKIPLDFLKKAYSGLHDLDLELAVKKVGIV